MKYLLTLFFSTLAVALFSQNCNVSTPVSQIVVFINLPDQQSDPNSIWIDCRGNSSVVFFDSPGQCYRFTLDSPMVLKVSDVSAPDISPLKMDPSKTKFAVQKLGAICSAVYEFTYYAPVATYKLKIDCDPQMTVKVSASIVKKNKPMSTSDLTENKVLFIWVSAYGSDWEYLYAYKVKEHIGKLGETEMQADDEIKKGILNNPTAPIVGPGQDLVRKFPLNAIPIEYTLSKSNVEN